MEAQIQIFLAQILKSLSNLEGISDLFKSEVSNEVWVLVSLRLTQNGVDPAHILNISKHLEEAGRGDCSLIIVNCLIQSYPQNLEAKAYQTKLLSDFDPNSAQVCCHSLLETPVFPAKEALQDVAYAADRMIELGMENHESYFRWIESALKHDRSPELLAYYAHLLRESRRYREAYAAASEAAILDCNGLNPNIAAALTANSLGEHDHSYFFLRRAFDIDPHATWWNMIVKFAPYFFPMLTSDQKYGRNDRVYELGNWLDQKLTEFPDLIYLPHRFTPWHVRAIREKRRERISQRLPSPLLVTQNKTGSVSVANILSSGFDLPCVTYSMGSLLVLPSMLREYLRGGACYVTHLEPTSQNIALLKAAGVRNVIVHVRDPRQIILSLVHHIQKYVKHAYSVIRDGTDDYSYDLRTRIDKVIDEIWLPTLRFQTGWLNASKSLDVSFTTFEQFMTDRKEFLRCLLSAYGGDLKYFNMNAAFNEDVNTDRHLRSGQLSEWREVFSTAQIDRVNSTMPRELADFFGWQI